MCFASVLLEPALKKSAEQARLSWPLAHGQFKSFSGSRPFTSFTSHTLSVCGHWPVLSTDPSHSSELRLNFFFINVRKIWFHKRESQHPEEPCGSTLFSEEALMPERTETKPSHPSEVCSAAQSCPTPCDSVDCIPPGSPVHEESPGKNTGVGGHALLQGIFPTQGANPGLRHCRWILYHLSQQGSLRAALWTKWIQHTKHWRPIWHTSALYVPPAAAAVLLTWSSLCILSPGPNVLGSYHRAAQTAQRMLDYRSAVQVATRDRRTQASKFCERVSLALICKMRGNICLHHDENFTKGAHDWESIF